MKVKNRINKIRHALWHIMHGVFPWMNFFEKRVSTPDFDHIHSKKFKARDYWPHLVMNYKCAVRHMVEAVFPFLEVKFK